MTYPRIFVVLTPFQASQMELVYPEQFRAANSLILYGEASGLDTTLFKGAMVPLQFEMFSVKDLLAKPFRYIPLYQGRIRNMEDFIHEVLKEYQPADRVEVVIGTDKDNFTQVLLNTLDKRMPGAYEVTAVEEGIGFYIKENFKDQMLAVAYQWLSPLLFGQSLRYHRQLATDPRITKAYVRFPGLVPEHANAKHITYHPLGDNSGKTMSLSDTNEVLIFSFPDQDFNMPEAEKYRIYDDLINGLKGYSKIHIKPHPRESTELFKAWEHVHLIDKSRRGEELDYSRFDLIVNFSSSIVVDLLVKGYPGSHIVTIMLRELDLAFFDRTVKVKLKDIKGFEFKDQAK